jgi:Flp pilus assembly protein TadB
MLVAILGSRLPPPVASRDHAGVTESTTPTAQPTRPGRVPLIAWGIGLFGHLVMLVWFAASGLVAPLWAVGGLLVLWAVLLVIGVRLRRRRPALMLLIPFLDVGVWVGVINAGERFLGWTA